MSPACRQPHTVILARFSALGDVAMTIPALYDACVSNPSTRFVMLTRPAFSRIFINRPPNLEVRGVDVRGEYAGIRGMWRLSRRVYGDVFVDLHDVLRTRMLGLFFRLRGIPTVRFDKARKAKKRLIREHGKRAGGTAPAVSPTITRYSEALLRAGLNTDDTFRGLFHDKRPDDGTIATVTRPKRAGETWIGIAPFAAHEGKVYPPDRMLEVAKHLARQAGTRIFLFGGGEKECEILEGWRAELGGEAVNMAAAKAGFATELAVMGALDVMVCMDSGNMHLAAIAGTPTVSVWGATHPSAGFAPVDPGHGHHVTVQREDLGCRPCSIFGNRACRRGDSECMNIPHDNIIRAVNTVLNANKQRS